MTYRIRAFEISLIIHVVLIAAVVSAGTLLDKPCHPLVISFDIAKEDGEEVNLSSAPTMPLEKQCRIKRTESLTKKIEAKITRNEPIMTTPISDVPIPVPAPRSTGGNMVSLKYQETSKTGATGGAVNDVAVRSHEGEGATKERYLREHFLYIKQRIIDRIVYPTLARKMGWYGNVLTSFVIHVDGTVSDIKILSSSGFKVLDENAIMTIKEVAPFPKPPTIAKIIIPVTYRLTSR